MAVNKVVKIDGSVIIDLSTDTVTSSAHIMAPYIGHLADGTQVTGTGQGGGTAAISVVDTEDSHGGTIRTVTALDISDTTAVAADVAQGKYFYTAQGIKTLGTASGGSTPSGQTVTGTVTGSGTTVLQIPCSFEPDVIYIYGDMSGDVANRGIVSITIIKDKVLYMSSDTSASNTDEYGTGIYHNITGYNESDTENIHATYTNGTLTIDTVQNSSATRFLSGQVYNYELSTISTGGSSTPSATSHSIYFEFSDETSTTITAYYDSAFVSDAIRATTPTTYDSKTVSLAQLDGVTWYEPAAIPLNTQLIDYTTVVAGYIIDASDGQEHASEWSCCSDFAEIDPSMTFSYVAYRWYDMAFYDSSKTYISGVTQDDYADTIENDYAHGTLSGSRIPSNAVYVRFSSYPNVGISSTQLSFIRTA